MHTLYDIEVQIPASNVHDTKAMPEIPYENGAFYIFDRGYNDFSNLYTIDGIGAYFVIRAKTNVKIDKKSWKRRLPDSIISDISGTFSGYKSSKDYPKEIRNVEYRP